MNLTNKKRRGYVVIATALCIAVFVGCAGIGLDITRMYIAKSEVQTYVDSAALAATLELDGTMSGFSRARNRVATNPNRRDFETRPFSNAVVSFGKDKLGPWEANPTTATGYKFARVSGIAPVSLTFMSVFAPAQLLTPPIAFLAVGPKVVDVKGDSAGGQVPKTYFSEGLFPFSPFAQSNLAPHYGLEPGKLHTLRWPSSPKLHQNLCPGDDTQAMLDLVNSAGSEERGYIESTSSDLIRKTIEDDYQTVHRQVGDSVVMTGGTKQTQLDSLKNRINQDSNAAALTYAQYVAEQTGNGRRIVAVPINLGPAANYKIVQIGAFLLRPTSEYDNSGNRPWCAEYVGAWLQGSKTKAVENSGAFVVRLTR